MDEVVVKRGLLYLQQQQTFGKKWRKFWGVLYRETACSSTRLELFEGSGPPAPEKLKKGESSKKLIKLSDCVHVVEANGDASSPKETTPFLVETTEKCYLLAAESMEVADWIDKLCELAFPRNRDEQMAAGGKDSHLGSLPSTACTLSMEENSLYSSRAKAAGATREFSVNIRATESSERCNLWGSFLLRATDDALELQDDETGGVLYTWPYKLLRRFGRDKMTFSFEAGRRCASGEGNFEFETRQGNEIFQVIELAIDAQKTYGMDDLQGPGPPEGTSWPPIRTLSWTKTSEERAANDKAKAPGGPWVHPSGSIKCVSSEFNWEERPTKGKCVKSTNSGSLTRETKGGFVPPGEVESPYSEPCDTLPWTDPSRPSAAKNKGTQGRGAPESDYAVPFDTIAKSFRGSDFNSFLSSLEKLPKPAPYSLYHSIKEASGKSQNMPPMPPASAKPDHIYDEPESLSLHKVYDEPEEVKGEAWKLQAMAEDPTGHEYPYSSQRDDYSVPKRAVPSMRQVPGQGKEWLGDTDYDNVALRFTKKKSLP
ncbi:PREDICTED: docking protein 2 isoform X1 [Crocodylus porosus]|uniref:docking protein 2 isoform X1 n=1 Tax=Crocodylus porosus TaxID=8502 RepID=UPI00093DD163|nr:PREDICTED: docking protein 2 isoform X1 [Crocodylus porosus]